MSVAHELVSNLRRTSDPRPDRRQEQDALPGMFVRDAIGRSHHSAGIDACPTIRTEGLSDPRIERPQMIEDFRRTSHCGAGARHAVALFDRDRGGEIGNMIDLRPRESLEELTRVGGERTHVSTLALGIERIEGQGRLARPRRSGNDRQGAEGNRTIDAPQIVRAGILDPDFSLHGEGQT